MFRYIDLFAGMGGIRLGLEQALFDKGMIGECVLTSEIKPYALKVYKDNFGEDNIQGDVSQIEGKDIPDFDMLLAGFPCQPFSMAGKRAGFEDTRGTLFFEIARILKEKQPKYFLLENVENLVSHDLSKENKKLGITIGRTLETILTVLGELGYKVTWKVIQASDYGVAQARRRIYIVGCKDKYISLDNFKTSFKSFGEIQEKNLPCVESDFSKKLFKYLDDNKLDISYLYDKAIRDKRGSNNNIHSWDLGLRGNLNQNQKDFMDNFILERRKKDLAEEKGLVYKEGIGLSKKDLKRIYNGENFDKDFQDLLHKSYIKEKVIENFSEKLYDINGGKLSYEFAKILDPNKPCLTLVATDVSKMAVIDGEGIRKLTLREGLRLNGYPENYNLDIDYNKGMDLLGNTVVVPVIKMICDRIIENERLDGSE